MQKLAVSLVTFCLLAACAQETANVATCGADLQIGAQVSVEGGRLARGATAFEPEERVGGAGDVTAFSIDAHEVTNQQFAAFVAATHYITVAERNGSDGQRLGAAIFDRGQGGWRLEANADWRHPEGAGSSIADRARYPVTMVAYEDAAAYAAWAGRRLPSENEWEFAMRGAAPAPEDVGAEAFDAQGRPIANTWQGFFPISDSGDDGHQGLAPIGCFAPNARGLYDMIGNVWEWTGDLYEDGVTPNDVGRPSGEIPRVIKGGSNLCAHNFCARFRSGSRQPRRSRPWHVAHRLSHRSEQLELDRYAKAMCPGLRDEKARARQILHDMSERLVERDIGI